MSKKKKKKQSKPVKNRKSKRSLQEKKANASPSSNSSDKKHLKEKIRELVLQGRKHFDAGEYDEALPYLNKVSELGEHALPDILNMLGLIYHYKGEFNKALEYFENALTINPDYTEASLNLAVTCNDLGRFKEAKFVYSRAIDIAKPAGALDPYVKGKLANMHAEIADVYSALGRYVEASDEYRKALGLRPTFVDIQTKLGVSLRESGLKTESLDILKIACRLDPNFLPAAINLGLTYFSIGKTKNAVKIWREVLKKDPEEEKAKMYLRLVGE